MSSTQEEDFYAILGIDEQASKEEIKTAFLKAQNAYQTLFDGRKRKAYDRRRTKNEEVRFNNFKSVFQSYRLDKRSLKTRKSLLKKSRKWWVTLKMSTYGART